MGLHHSKMLLPNNDQDWSPERIELELGSHVTALQHKIRRYEKRRRYYDLERVVEYKKAVAQMQQLLEGIQIAKQINLLNRAIDTLEHDKGYHSLVTISKSTKDVNHALMQLDGPTIAWLTQNGFLDMHAVG